MLLEKLFPIWGMVYQHENGRNMHLGKLFRLFFAIQGNSMAKLKSLELFGEGMLEVLMVSVCL
jgi:hypothetical protein